MLASAVLWSLTAVRLIFSFHLQHPMGLLLGTLAQVPPMRFLDFDSLAEACEQHLHSIDDNQFMPGILLGNILAKTFLCPQAQDFNVCVDAPVSCLTYSADMDEISRKKTAGEELCRHVASEKLFIKIVVGCKMITYLIRKHESRYLYLRL